MNPSRKRGQSRLGLGVSGAEAGRGVSGFSPSRERPRQASCQSAASSLLRGMTHRNVVDPEEPVDSVYPIRRKVCLFLLGAGRRVGRCVFGFFGGFVHMVFRLASG